MSSGAIMAQIGNCKSQISNIELSKRKLEDKIERQEHAIRQFTLRVNDVDDEINAKKRAVSSIFTLSSTVVFAQRLGEQFDADYVGICNDAILKTQQMEQQMHNSNMKSCEELELLEQTLSSQKSHLTNLESEYRAALAREEAERQAAN